MQYSIMTSAAEYVKSLKGGKLETTPLYATAKRMNKVDAAKMLREIKANHDNAAAILENSGL